MRNSGATAVGDGEGDHGCEYTTGGVVLVLDRIGLNFAAGMSGRLASVHDEKDFLLAHHNHETSEAARLTNSDEIASLRHLLERHAEFTGGIFAQKRLQHWERTVNRFWKIIPHFPSAASRRRFFISRISRLSPPDRGVFSALFSNG